MNFKFWLQEWEGFNFSQERDLVNGPQYPRSKYKGPYSSEEQPAARIIKDTKKQFGFKNKDPLLKLQK